MIRYILIILGLSLGVSGYSQHEFFPVRVDGLYGLVTADGMMIVPTNNCTSAVYRHTAVVESGPYKSLTFISLWHNEQKLFGYSYVGNWKNYFILKNELGQLAFYDPWREKLKKTAFRSYRHGSRQTLIVQSANEQWGVVDSNLQELIPAKYEKLRFNSKSFLAKHADKQITIDTLGNELYHHESFVTIHDGWFPIIIEEEPGIGYKPRFPKEIEVKGGWKNAYRLNEYIIRLVGPKQDLIVDMLLEVTFSLGSDLRLQPGLVFHKIRSKNKVGLITRSGDIVLEPLYKDVRTTNNYLFLLKSTGWGLANQSGNILLDCEYNEISEVDGTMLLFNKKGKYGLSQIDGKAILPPRFKQISVMGDVIKAFKGTKVILYNLDPALSIRDSLIFNQVINSVYTNNKQRLLISSKDTASNVSFGKDWYYSEQYACWRLYDAERKRAFGKHHLIATGFKNGNLLSSNYHIKPRVALQLDTTYYSDVTQGLFSKSNNRKIIPKSYVALFPEDPLEGRLYRFLDRNGQYGMYYTYQEKELGFRATFIDTGYECGFRINIGGKWASGDSLTFVPISNKLDFLSSHSLLDKTAPFNERWLRSQNIGIEGGTWMFMNAKGKLDKQEQYDWLSNCQGKVAIALQNDDWKLIRPGTSARPISENNKLLRRMHFGRHSLYLFSKKDSLVGYINRNGDLVKPPGYTDGGNYSNGRAAVKEGGKWYYVDSNFYKITTLSFSQAQDFQKNLGVAKSGSYWKIINRSGEFANNESFFRLNSYNDAYTWGVKRGGWYIIDTTGNIMNQKPFKTATPFSHGRALAGYKEKGKKALINGKGEKLSRCRFEPVWPLNENKVMAVKKGQRCLLIDSNGRRVLGRSFKAITQMKDGWSMAYGSKNTYAISYQGKLVKLPHEYGYEILGEGLILISSGAQLGLMDTNATIIANPEYQSISGVGENKILAQTDHDLGVCLDLAGNKLFEYSGSFKSEFCNGLALIKNSEGFYYITSSGKNAFSNYYANASAFVGNRAKVEIDGKWHLINLHGKVLNKEGFHQIHLVEGNLIRITELSDLGLMDAEGHVLIDPIMTHISRYDDHVVKAEHYNNTYYYDLRTRAWIYR